VPDVENFKPATVYTIYIAATLEQVWQALSSAEFSRKYFFGQAVEVDPRIGGAYIMRTPDGALHISGGKQLGVGDEHAPEGSRVTAFAFGHCSSCPCEPHGTHFTVRQIPYRATAADPTNPGGPLSAPMVSTVCQHRAWRRSAGTDLRGDRGENAVDERPRVVGRVVLGQLDRFVEDHRRGRAAGIEELPIEATREGDAKGLHTLEARGTADRLVLTHEAFSRRGFAEGAVRAAEWVATKTGSFDFREVYNQLQ